MSATAKHEQEGDGAVREGVPGEGVATQPADSPAHWPKVECDNLVWAEEAVALIIQFLGEDPGRDGLKDTPARVIRALRELTAGYGEDPAQILSTTFDVVYDEMVVLRGIRFTSLCEHHMLPFTGEVDLGYIPSARVVGLSKLARLVHCFAKRLQVQERLTTQLTSALEQHLKPKGSAAIVRARHSCMGNRGVKEPHAEMVTSSLKGIMREPQVRAEFLRLTGD